jgi:tetratricopeptide (TPR) repeat protein
MDRLRRDAPDADALLNLWAFLAPDDIPRGLLADIDTPVLEPFATLSTDRLMYNKALRAIGRYSLAQIGMDKIAVHRLVQTVVRAQLPSDEQQALAKLAACLVVAALPDDPNDVETWATARCFVPHLIRVAEHLAALGIHDGLAASMLASAAQFARAFGDMHTSHDLVQRAVTLAANDEDASALLPALRLRLAETFVDLGHLDHAADLQRQQIADLTKTHGPSHPAVLLAMSELTATHHQAGNLQAALELGEHLVEATEKVCEKDHPLSLSAKSRLAATLHSLGDRERSQALSHVVLDTLKRTHGEHHLETLTAMNNLATTLADDGDLGRAAELHQEVLAARMEVLGRTHPSTLDSMANYGHVLWRQGRRDDAEQLAHQALDAARSQLGETHPRTLMAYNSLVAALEVDDPEAIPLQIQTLEGLTTTLGEHHPATLTAMNNLGMMLIEIDLPRAIKILTRTGKLHGEHLGPEHPDTLMAIGNLASARMREDDPEPARAMLAELFDVQKRSLGMHHEGTLRTMHNLAITVERLGDHTNAQELWATALTYMVCLEDRPTDIATATAQDLAQSIADVRGVAGPAAALQCAATVTRAITSAPDAPIDAVLAALDTLELALWRESLIREALVVVNAAVDAETRPETG